MPLKILLADDSHVTLNLGKKILTDAGFDVTTADGGDAAVEKLARFKPDLIVLDAYMPGFDGFELCRAMKSVRRTARIPIVLTAGKLEPLFSGDSTGADDGTISQFVQKRLFTRFRSRGSAAKADAILRKPFDAADLVYVVQQLTHSGNLPAGTAAGKAQAGKEKPALRRLTSGWAIILQEPKVPDELVVARPPSANTADLDTSDSQAMDSFLPSQPPELSEILSVDLRSSEIHALFPESADLDFNLYEPGIGGESGIELMPAGIAKPAPELTGHEDLAVLALPVGESPGSEMPVLPSESDWLPVPEIEAGFDWRPRCTEGDAVFEGIAGPIDWPEGERVWAPAGAPESGFDWAPQPPIEHRNSGLDVPDAGGQPNDSSLPTEPSPTTPEFADVEPPAFECSLPEMPGPAIVDLEITPHWAEVLPTSEGPPEAVNERHGVPTELDGPTLGATEVHSDPDIRWGPISEIPPHLDYLRDTIADAFAHDAEMEPAASTPEPIDDGYSIFDEPVLEVNCEPDDQRWGASPSRTVGSAPGIRRATVREEWIRFVPVPRPAQEESAATVPSAPPHLPPATFPAVLESQPRSLSEPFALASSHDRIGAAHSRSADYRSQVQPAIVSSGNDDQVTLDLDMLALSLIPEPVHVEDPAATLQETAATQDSGPMEDIDLERFLAPQDADVKTSPASPYTGIQPSHSLLQAETPAEEEEPVPIAFDLAKYLALTPIGPVETLPSSHALGPSALFAEPPLGATAEQMVDEALERIRPGLIEEARRMLSQHSDAAGTAK